MKLKKRKKSSRLRGSKTAFWGSRKKHKGSGHRGGKGMAGTGKRADQRKTFVLKYMYPYFGKKGFTSRKTEKKKNNVINLNDIEKNLNSFEKKKMAKKINDKWEINLTDYKILSRGEVENKLVINAKSASKEAIEKIEKAGGKIILKKRTEIAKKETETKSEIEKAGGKPTLKKLGKTKSEIEKENKEK